MHNIEHGILMESDSRRFPIEWYFTGGILEHIVIGGIHGDERWALEAGNEALNNMDGKAQNMFFIPQLAPFAFHQGTRVNEQGLNINRHAYKNSLAWEVAALMRYMHDLDRLHRIETGRALHFKTARTIHGDFEFGSYLYINGRLPSEWRINRFRDEMRSLQIPLHTGYDDDVKKDPSLGNWVEEGFVLQAGGEGTIEEWMLQYADTVIGMEIGKDLSFPQQVVFFNKVHEHFVLPLSCAA